MAFLSIKMLHFLSIAIITIIRLKINGVFLPVYGFCNREKTKKQKKKADFALKIKKSFAKPLDKTNLSAIMIRLE